MSGTEQLGIVAQRQRDRETYGRFAYKAPIPGLAKNHSITVDLAKPGERIVRVMAAPKPAPVKPPEPVPEIIQVPVTLRPRNSGNWRRITDDGVEERVRAILRATAAAFDVGAGEMMDPCRARRLAYPRFAAMILIRKLCRLSLSTIGRVLHRDHTTILAGIDKGLKLRRIDADFRRRSIAIAKALRGQAGTQQ